MAESLTDWLASSVRKAAVVSSKQSAAEGDDVDLGDIAFQRGSKVQIKRFLKYEEPSGDGPGQRPLAQDAHHAQGGEDGEATAPMKPALWAVVGDRCCEVLVRFSPECVTWFDTAHIRELISLSRAIIQLLSFRISISAVGPRMLMGETGPFAPAVSPRLCLEVEGLQVWGCINNVNFWGGCDLQDHLGTPTAESDTSTVLVGMQRPTPTSPEDAKNFRTWLASARRMLSKRATNQSVQKRPRRGRCSAQRQDVVETPERVSIPPPFQPPNRRPRPKRTEEDLHVSPTLGRGDPSLPSFSAASLGKAFADNYSQTDGWGDFDLSQAAGDYGLDKPPLQERDGGRDRAAAEAMLAADLFSSDVLHGVTSGENELALLNKSGDHRGVDNDEILLETHTRASQGRSEPREESVLRLDRSEDAAQATETAPASASWRPPVVDLNTLLPFTTADSRAEEPSTPQGDDVYTGEGEAQQEDSALPQAEQKRKRDPDPPAAARRRVKITRRITDEEREAARREYDDILAQLGHQ